MFISREVGVYEVEGFNNKIILYSRHTVDTDCSSPHRLLASHNSEILDFFFLNYLLIFNIV